MAGRQPRAMAAPNLAAGLVERWDELHDGDERFGVWAVEVRDTGLVAGTVLFKPLPDGDGEVEVGWHFHPDSWGHGYATEAARGAIARGFAHGLPEIYAVVRPDNEPSLAVCRRLGMTPLGRTNRWYGIDVEAFRIGAGRMTGVTPREIVLLGSHRLDRHPGHRHRAAQPGPVPGGRRSAPAAATSRCSPPRRWSSGVEVVGVAKVDRRAGPAARLLRRGAASAGYATGDFRIPKILAGPDGDGRAGRVAVRRGAQRGRRARSGSRRRWRRCAPAVPSRWPTRSPWSPAARWSRPR